jgi:hypothetical protein
VFGKVALDLQGGHQMRQPVTSPRPGTTLPLGDAISPISEQTLTDEYLDSEEFQDGFAMNADTIRSAINGQVDDEHVEDVGALHDYAGYSGGGSKAKVESGEENSRGGHKTGAFTDIGEGRSGVTVSKRRPS